MSNTIESVLKGEAGKFGPIPFDTLPSKKGIEDDRIRSLLDLRQELNSFAFTQGDELLTRMMSRRWIESEVLKISKEIYTTLMQLNDPIKEKFGGSLLSNLLYEVVTTSQFLETDRGSDSSIIELQPAFRLSSCIPTIYRHLWDKSSFGVHRHELDYLLLSSFLKNYRMVTYLNLLTFPVESLETMSKNISDRKFFDDICTEICEPNPFIRNPVFRPQFNVSLLLLGLPDEDRKKVTDYFMAVYKITQGVLHEYDSIMGELFDTIDREYPPTSQERKLGIIGLVRNMVASMDSKRKYDGDVPKPENAIESKILKKFCSAKDSILKVRKSVRGKIISAAKELGIPVGPDTGPAGSGTGLPKIVHYVKSLYGNEFVAGVYLPLNAGLNEMGNLLIKVCVYGCPLDSEYFSAFGFSHTSTYCTNGELQALIGKAIQTKRNATK